MRKSLYLSRIFLIAFLLVWGLYTKAHPGYDMVLCGEKIGSVKNRTQAEDILEIIRHETNSETLPFSLYLRLFKSAPQSDAALLLENARRAANTETAGREDELPTEEVLPASTEQSDTFLFAPPLSGAWVSSPFGMRDGKIHEGIDLAHDHGTPILAIADGTVTFSGNAEGYGKLIIISHENGYESYYAHCSTLYCSEGDHVRQGETIAEVGSTGKSTGPHLHFEIRKDGAPQDPLLFLGDSFT